MYETKQDNSIHPILKKQVKVFLKILWKDQPGIMYKGIVEDVSSTGVLISHYTKGEAFIPWDSISEIHIGKYQ